ncbi:MAG: prepilin peptidase [Lentisphaerae bacterium]|nr:prepilin peptidase [Lentisphaerota bacterium]
MSVYDIICAMPLADLIPLGVYIVFAFIFGSCLGSFLNVCIWRIPLGESVVFVPSHCPKCNHKIRWFDNVPVIGFLALGGKCRDCKAPISPRYIIMELLVGVLFTVPAVLIYMGEGAAKDLISLTIMLSVVVPCAFIDIEHRKLPDKLTYFGMISGVLFNWVFIAGRGMSHADSLLWSLHGLLAGVIGLGVFAWLTGKLMKKRTLGAGDVKYAGFIGATCGMPGLLIILATASILAVAGWVMAAVFRKKVSSDGMVPFGPYLGIAFYVIYLLGWLSAAI